LQSICRAGPSWSWPTLSVYTIITAIHPPWICLWCAFLADSVRLLFFLTVVLVRLLVRTRLGSSLAFKWSLRWALILILSLTPRVHSFRCIFVLVSPLPDPHVRLGDPNLARI
jgi:hypothetical protein